MEQAQEEQFFRKLQQDQLKKMKTDTESDTTKDDIDKDKEKKKSSKWDQERRFLLFMNEFSILVNKSSTLNKLQFFCYSL